MMMIVCSSNKDKIYKTADFPLLISMCQYINIIIGYASSTEILYMVDFEQICKRRQFN